MSVVLVSCRFILQSIQDTILHVPLCKLIDCIQMFPKRQYYIFESWDKVQFIDPHYRSTGVVINNLCRVIDRTRMI